MYTKEMQWEEVYDLVLEIVQISDYKNFFVFWEQYVDELEESETLQMAEWVGLIQLAMPHEYAERTRNLRMRL